MSNFSDHPFNLRGIALPNVEAFVQGIKYPADSPERVAVFQLAARKAKRRSPHIPPTFIEWEGSSLPYRSQEHYRLQAVAIFGKFDQNRDARQSLLATGDLRLIHDLGRPERPTTCLPAAVFTRILEETRAYFARQYGHVALEAMGIIEPVFITTDLVSYARSSLEVCGTD